MIELAIHQSVRDAFDRGQPYQVCPLESVSNFAEDQLLTAMQERGLITGDIDPVLTSAGVAVAVWFKGQST